MRDKIQFWNIFMLYNFLNLFSLFSQFHMYVCMYACMLVFCYVFRSQESVFKMMYVCACVNEHNSTQTMLSVELLFSEYVTGYCCKNCIHFHTNHTMGLASKQFLNNFVIKEITDKYHLFKFSYFLLFSHFIFIRLSYFTRMCAFSLYNLDLNCYITFMQMHCILYSLWKSK